MTTLSRRKLLGAGTGGALLMAAPAIITSRKALARDKKLVFWIQPNFNKSADDLLIAQTMEFGKIAGLKDSDIQILKVPGGEIAKKMAAALEVGAPPDITRVNEANMAHWVGGGHLLPVTEIVEKMRKVPGGINESVMPIARSGDEYYGAPMGLNPQAGHARVDLLEKAGYSDFPDTWESFVEACEKINDPPFYAYGMALGLTPSDSLWETMTVVWAHGGALVDDQNRPAFASEGSKQAFALINEMYNKKRIIPRGALSWNNGGNNKAYQSGQIGYCLNPTSIYSSLIKNNSEYLDKTGLFGPPGGPAGRHRCLYSDFYGVFRKAAEPELVKGLIEHLLEPANYADFIVGAGGRYFPSYASMVDDPFWQGQPVFKDLLKTVEEGHTLYWPGKLTNALGEVATQTVVQKELQQVLVDGKDPGNAVADVQKQMVAIFERNAEPV